MIEKLIIIAIIAATAGFIVVRILRLTRGKRPDCCSGGGKKL
jgi:hypothetical protein